MVPGRDARHWVKHRDRQGRIRAGPPVHLPHQDDVRQTDNPHKDEIPFRAAFLPTAVLTLAAPQLALAKAALDLVTEKAATRGISYTYYDIQAQAPTVQLALANAASLIETAELLAYNAAAEIDHMA